jgi:hypothetical protein
MSKTEDLLYEAHDEGIRDEVLLESKKLHDSGGEYTYMEFADRLEIALRNIREKNKNENI